MFQVTTLDLNNVPKTEDGQVDYSQDFFGKKTSLTVSGQLNAENFAMALAMSIPLVLPSVRRIPTPSVTPLSSGWWSLRWPSPI